MTQFQVGYPVTYQDDDTVGIIVSIEQEVATVQYPTHISYIALSELTLVSLDTNDQLL